MLQQTRVDTAIPYFDRFLTRFPDARALAAATLDEVLHHWSGLGYYARARNLHRAAALLVESHGGELPTDLNALQDLPGIGRSTAGAVLALGYGRRAAILDGNARRVLARHEGVADWPGTAAVARRLWSIADRFTPQQRVGQYTQAIMDLGATVCSRTRPQCHRCPVARTCHGHASGDPEAFPGRRPRRQLPVRAVNWFIARRADGHVLMIQRPPTGIWGGLWAFPEYSPCTDPTALTPMRHVFTHFILRIQPLLVPCDATAGAVRDQPQLWIDPAAPPEIGLATPVKHLLDSLAKAAQKPSEPVP